MGNIRDGSSRIGKPSRALGKHWKLSSERKEQLSLFMMGDKNPMFGKRTKGFTGHIHSKESREKISKSNTGKPCPERGRPRTTEQRLALKTLYKGMNNPNWRGGVSTLSASIRWLDEYRIWRWQIYKRDRYSCINCGYRSKGKQDIIADHIKPFSIILKENNIKTLEQATECSELWDLSNGRTLCKPCDKLLGWKYRKKKLS